MCLLPKGTRWRVAGIICVLPACCRRVLGYVAILCYAFISRSSLVLNNLVSLMSCFSFEPVSSGTNTSDLLGF